MLAVELYKHGCILFGEFKLSSGLSSPYYIDLRKVPSFPELMRKVLDAYLQKIWEEGITFDGICGIATAGIPISSVLAYKLEKPFVYVRKEEKAHGTKRMLEGVVRDGEKILVVDDVATTGGNLILAVSVLREVGATVDDALVLIDREQGGEEALRNLGVKLHSCLKVSQIVRELYAERLIDGERLKLISEYIGKKDV